MVKQMKTGENKNALWLCKYGIDVLWDWERVIFLRGWVVPVPLKKKNLKKFKIYKIKASDVFIYIVVTLQYKRFRAHELWYHFFRISGIFNGKTILINDPATIWIFVCTSPTVRVLICTFFLSYVIFKVL